MKAAITIALLLLMFAAAGFARTAVDPWRDEIDALTAHDNTQAPPRNGVLFVGSSSIRLWTTLADDFPGVAVINRGFGGSLIADSTRHADRIIVPYEPKLVVLYAGDNDIGAGHSPEQVIADFQVFVARVRRALPHAAIAFVSIKPSVARVARWPQMQVANAGIEHWSRQQKDVVYVDAATRMLDATGKPRAELLREDGLHMNRAGYEIWIAALRPVLARFGFATR